ncbi:hypothetical protein AVEN_101500-1 [Araneus ventricosus]|uniref:Uncharacterized protein n=1 Tax=Araneus ventricosus TaxID=182803 RepID=A0A4Y2FCJ9_ARAVE|nr:hypothetical protein AVEN_101500-1 [Araneus ventricosus]
MSQRRRNRSAAQRQISEKVKNEKKEPAKQLRRERAERYYEKNKQKKNFITNYVLINIRSHQSHNLRIIELLQSHRATLVHKELLQSHRATLVHKRAILVT